MEEMILGWRSGWRGGRDRDRGLVQSARGSGWWGGERKREELPMKTHAVHESFDKTYQGPL